MAQFRLEAERERHQQEQESMRLVRDESLGTNGLSAISADDWGIVFFFQLPKVWTLESLLAMMCNDVWTCEMIVLAICTGTIFSYCQNLFWNSHFATFALSRALRTNTALCLQMGQLQVQKHSLETENLVKIVKKR